MKRKILLLFLLLLTLTACGSPSAGTYTLYAIRIGDMTTSADNTESAVVLKSNGRGTWSFSGQESALSNWTLNGDDLTLTLDDSTLTGTLSSGILTLELDGQAFIYAAKDADLSLVDLETTDDWIEAMK